MSVRAIAATAALLCACEGGQNLVPLDPDLNRMIEQPRWDLWEESAFFADGRTMRLPPPGTIPQRASDDGGRPARIDEALLAEGRRLYGIHCAPCHGLLGDAETVVAANFSLVAPRTFHSPTMRARPADHFYRVITYGYGMMPSYGWQLDERQRWAVVAWVRALQRSRHVRLDELPFELQRRAREALAP